MRVVPLRVRRAIYFSPVSLLGISDDRFTVTIGERWRERTTDALAVGQGDDLRPPENGRVFLHCVRPELDGATADAGCEVVRPCGVAVDCTAHTAGNKAERPIPAEVRIPALDLWV